MGSNHRLTRFVFAAAVAFFSTAALAQFSGIVPVTQASVTFGSVTSRTKIISGIAGKLIYITAFITHPVQTSVITLTYGSGTNCGTGTTDFYGPSTFQNSENAYIGNGAGALFVVPDGKDVCVTVATALAPGWISYGQF